MTAVRLAPIVAPDEDRGRRRALIATLAVTQTVGYGVITYAFGVLLRPIATDLHRSVAAVTGAVTCAVVASAVAAVPIGRWLDRHGGRALMTIGSTVAVAGIVASSQVQQLWQLYVAFVVLGVAGAASLYEAAFAVLIANTGPARNQAMLAVTMVAGFASSIFFPLTGWLLQWQGWRGALLWLAGLLGLTAIPGHLLVVPPRRAHPTVRRKGPGAGDAVRDPGLWLVAAAFLAQGAAVSSVGLLLVTFLRHAGQTTTIAATLAGLLGVLSVTGRLVTTGLARRHGMPAVAAVVFAIQAASLFTLPHTAGSVGWAAVSIAAFGLGFGVATIARPVILADRYGTVRYATIAAIVGIPVTLAKAVAPIGAATLGVDRFMPWAGGACLLAAVLLWTSRRPPRSGLDRAEVPQQTLSQ